MKPSIIHYYLYGMFKRQVGKGVIIHLSQIHPIIKWAIRLPRKYQVEIINEMVECGFLKKLCRDSYELNIIENKNMVCDSLGDTLW